MKEIRTAVIILNWNNVHDTANCLESLFNSNVQALPIVVDNASTKPGFEGLNNHFPNAVYIQNEENMGFGRGNNVGLKWALTNTAAEYLFILNNDTLVQEEAIETMETFLDLHSHVGAVAPQIIFADDPQVVWYGGGDINWRRGSARTRNWRGAINLEADPTAVTFASGCAIMIRRTVLEAVGGFDPQYFMYEEDVDFSLRINQMGYNIYYIPKAVVYHRVQGSQREVGESFFTLQSPQNPRLPFLMYHITQNRLLNMYKYCHGWHRLEFLIFFPAYMMLKVFQYMVYGRWDAIKAILNGYLSYRNLRGTFYIDEINGRKYAIKRLSWQ